MKKEPDALEIKAHFQFWRDRYQQTKSAKDLFEMQKKIATIHTDGERTRNRQGFFDR